MIKLPFDLLKQEIDYVVVNNDFQGAFECYNLTKKWLDESGLAKNSSDYIRYNNYLIKLKFLSFNYLSDINERVELLKNYFNSALEIDGFKLWEKIEIELISISSLDTRDDFKAKMREALEKCEDVLINRQKYINQEIPRKVDEWIKNFIVNLGLDSFDKVKKMEYLSSSRYLKILDEKDKDKVKTLLDIYEKLKISSKTPEGYENSVLMNIDDKAIIFDHGNVEEVSSLDKIKNVSKLIDSVKDDVLSDSISSAPVPASSSAANVVSVQPQKLIIPRTVELEEILNSYSPSSLEYKAISQEILRLKKAEARKDAKR
jgi:hypothetical protein